ncbi:MAG: hypothetical protein DRP06_02485 [Candidatus Aenigmatarchaeota archaeon]|nr:MAG: hypothetical protein DRP06_02485 [Candidatus Aenigmarchaeota archaeon]
MNKLFSASFTLAGTIIGAGVLGLPYVIGQSGFLIGLGWMVIIGLLTLLVYLMLGEITLRTKEPHQLPGLAEKYIGKKMKHLIAFLSISWMYGSLIAYVQGSGELINSIFGIHPFIAKLIFFVPFSIIVYFGVRGVEETEYLMTPVIIFSILLLSIASLFYFEPSNILKMEMSNYLAPVGIIMFALAGMSAIPQMKEILWKEKKKLKKSILIGFSIPFFTYIVFTMICIGALGSNISEVATISLGEQYGTFFLVFGNLFAFVAMATCFVSLGNSLIEVYNQDYGMSKNISYLGAMLPALIAFFGVSSFTEILSLTGCLFIAPLMVSIVYLFIKTREKGERKPEYELKIPDWTLWTITLFFVFATALVGWQFLLF